MYLCPSRYGPNTSKPALHPFCPNKRVHAFITSRSDHFLHCSVISKTIFCDVTPVHSCCHFSATLQGMFENVCWCMHLQALFFIFLSYTKMCASVDLSVCMRFSPFAWKWNEITDLASEIDILRQVLLGFYVLLLRFWFCILPHWEYSQSHLSPFFPSLLHLLLQGSILLLFPLSLISCHFIKCVSLSLKMTENQ